MLTWNFGLWYKPVLNPLQRPVAGGVFGVDETMVGLRRSPFYYSTDRALIDPLPA